MVYTLLLLFRYTLIVGAVVARVGVDVVGTNVSLEHPGRSNRVCSSVQTIMRDLSSRHCRHLSANWRAFSSYNYTLISVKSGVVRLRKWHSR